LHGEVRYDAMVCNFFHESTVETDAITKTLLTKKASLAERLAWLELQCFGKALNPIAETPPAAAEGEAAPAEAAEAPVAAEANVSKVGVPAVE